jgi:hypothetical protein
MKMKFNKIVPTNIATKGAGPNNLILRIFSKANHALPDAAKAFDARRTRHKAAARATRKKRMLTLKYRSHIAKLTTLYCYFFYKWSTRFLNF